MRTVSADMATMLATHSHTRCRMLRFDLREGTKLGFTDHDKNLDFDLSDGDGTITYRADLGITTSDIEMNCGLEAGNCEVTGPVSSVFTKEAILGGRFHYATAYVFEVNWKRLVDGPIRFMKGNATELRIEGGQFVGEIRDLRDKFNQTVGRTITNMCHGEHSACCVNIAPETATTVLAVTNARQFTVAATLTDNHVPGRLWFTSGALAGTLPVEIYARTGDTVTLFTDLAELPAVGDALTVKEGCDRTRTMCRDRFNNVIEFRGYPEIPGSDQILRMPIPGQGGE